MLRFWILNVGHGDSIVVEYKNGEDTVFGVVDSNLHPRASRPAALTKLRALGATHLSFVVLTHPHADHYTGMSEILKAYEGEIDHFYSFPIQHWIPGRLKTLFSLYQKHLGLVDSPKVRKGLVEFIDILNLVENGAASNWEEPVGVYSALFPTGFRGVDITFLLPPARVKGGYFQMIQSGDIGLLGSEKENDLSLAISFEYHGAQVILGGDGTYNNWAYHERSLARGGRELSSTAVKLPHHGSKYDCKPNVIDHLFGNAEARFACISANGAKHPHTETLKTLAHRGIHPYCTNLARICGMNVHPMISEPELAPVLRRFINSNPIEPTPTTLQSCQGEICVTMDASGEVEVEPQHRHPCGFRGDLELLFTPSP